MYQTLEHFAHELPSPVRERLLNFMRAGGSMLRMASTLSDAINESGAWYNSREGADYWRALRIRYRTSIEEPYPDEP